MPLAEAETTIAFARFLRRTGRPRRAGELLRRALASLEPTGCERLRRAAEEELSVAGARRASPGNAGTLTGQEQRGAALAAEGLTNPEIARRLFLSAKTVDHHLSRAYAKHGIRSRRELIRSWPR